MTTNLRQRMTEDMQVRNLSLLTQSSYVQQVSMFARHFNKSPEVLGIEDIRNYQLYMTNQKKLSASSIKVAVSAIRFLYSVTLGRPWDFDEVVPSPKKPRTLPIILSPEEVVHFLGCVMNVKQRTILTTCYAAGSVRVRASKCSLRSDRRPRSIRRLARWPLRSQCDGGRGACGCWRKHVDEGGSGDGGGYAIHRSLDRTGQPIVGT